MKQKKHCFNGLPMLSSSITSENVSSATAEKRNSLRQLCVFTGDKANYVLPCHHGIHHTSFWLKRQLPYMIEKVCDEN